MGGSAIAVFVQGMLIGMFMNCLATLFDIVRSIVCFSLSALSKLESFTYDDGQTDYAKGYLISAIIFAPVMAIPRAISAALITEVY